MKKFFGTLLKILGWIVMVVFIFGFPGTLMHSGTSIQSILICLFVGAVYFFAAFGFIKLGKHMTKAAEQNITNEIAKNI